MFQVGSDCKDFQQVNRKQTDQTTPLFCFFLGGRNHDVTNALLEDQILLSTEVRAIFFGFVSVGVGVFEAGPLSAFV